MIEATFENGEQCDGSKILGNVHKIPAKFEDDRNSTVTNSGLSLREFDAEEMYLHLHSLNLRENNSCSDISDFSFLVYRAKTKSRSKISEAMFERPFHGASKIAPKERHLTIKIH